MKNKKIIIIIFIKVNAIIYEKLFNNKKKVLFCRKDYNKYM